MGDIGRRICVSAVIRAVYVRFAYCLCPLCSLHSVAVGRSALAGASSGELRVLELNSSHFSCDVEPTEGSELTWILHRRRTIDHLVLLTLDKNVKENI